MERALFRGKDKKTANARYDLVNTAFHSPLLEKPEDVAQAVWKAVKHRRKDVVVGTYCQTVDNLTSYVSWLDEPYLPAAFWYGRIITVRVS